MEGIEIKLENISFNGDTPGEAYTMKDKDPERQCLSMLARSTPASPNSFRCNNTTHNVVGSSKDLTNKTRSELQFLTVSILPKLEKCISEPEMCNKDCTSKTQRSEESSQNDVSCPGSKSDGHISRMAFKLPGKVEVRSTILVFSYGFRVTLFMSVLTIIICISVSTHFICLFYFCSTRFILIKPFCTGSA